jgi:uncharacterized protein
MRIRDLTVADLAEVVTLNNANTPAVNAKTLQQLSVMLAESTISLGAFDDVEDVDDGLLGFLITFPPGTSYESLNYAWFSANYDEFAYMDRIVVAPEARGQSIGAALYGVLFERLGSSVPLVGIDVNLRPPNEGSIRFHQRLGFVEVAQQQTDGGNKTVSLMVKHLP